jgi:hypothetical protein
VKCGKKCILTYFTGKKSLKLFCPTEENICS